MSALVLDAVSRWYGNVVAVNDVSLSIGPGVTGLLGPNGAGKSTLIALMSGFLPPSSGTVTLDGEPVWRNPEVYRAIGYFGLWDASVETLRAAGRDVNYDFDAHIVRWSRRGCFMHCDNHQICINPQQSTFFSFLFY